VQVPSNYGDFLSTLFHPTVTDARHSILQRRETAADRSCQEPFCWIKG
jgi:hypothetical protein